MLGITASKVPGTLAYFYWRQNMIRLYYTMGSINNFLTLNYL